MNITIRKATDADLHTLQKLTASLFIDLKKYEPLLTTDFVYREDGAFVKKYLKKGIYLIASEGSEVIGFALLTVRESEEIPYKQAELHHIYVEKGSRGRGVGTLLLNKFVDWAQRTGARSCYLGAFAANPAVEFYKSHGFSIWSVGMERKLAS